MLNYWCFVLLQLITYSSIIYHKFVTGKESTFWTDLHLHIYQHSEQTYTYIYINIYFYILMKILKSVDFVYIIFHSIFSGNIETWKVRGYSKQYKKENEEEADISGQLIPSFSRSHIFSLISKYYFLGWISSKSL